MTFLISLAFKKPFFLAIRKGHHQRDNDISDNDINDISVTMLILTHAYTC